MASRGREAERSARHICRHARHRQRLGRCPGCRCRTQATSTPDIKILLIGEGKRKAALLARAQQERLDHVLFHDAVGKEQMARLMAAADVGLQILANVPAFYYGTSPNKFFDYISSGLPVLNNYPGWLADMIVEHRCGFAVAPDNPQAFADALEQAANDREELRQMGKRARALAEEQFNRSILASRWIDTLENTVSRHTAVPLIRKRHDIYSCSSPDGRRLHPEYLRRGVHSTPSPGFPG